MPYYVMLLRDDPEVPSNFETVNCDGCGQSGWASPGVLEMQMQTVRKVCPDCYWFREVDRVVDRVQEGDEWEVIITTTQTYRDVIRAHTSTGAGTILADAIRAGLAKPEPDLTQIDEVVTRQYEHPARDEVTFVGPEAAEARIARLRERNRLRLEPGGSGEGNAERDDHS